MQHVPRILIRSALAPLALLALASWPLLSTGCQAPQGEIGKSPELPATPAVPVVGISLDRIARTNAGLLSGVDSATGYPATSGPTMDPLILEARRFYDVVNAPGAREQPVPYPDPFSGAPPGMRRTAPLNFEDWKTTFGFSSRTAGESLEAYRQRTNVVVYYNRNELGLGRELACADFVDGTDPNGQPIKGVACYVTNYGSVFRDQAHSLAEAIEGKHPRNTVCISWRPSMQPGYEVQFYVYGPDGARLDWAQLDNHGPRPHPQVCMNCHGGVYDEEKHLAKHARFLPMDPNIVTFASGGSTPPSLTREGQEESIRLANLASTRTPLSPGQQELLQELYGGQIQVPGAVSRNSWVPVAWRGNPVDEQLFDKVVKPYCGTCHLALQTAMDGSTLYSYNLFRSPQDLRRFPLASVLCGTFGMPNAQPTMVNFWDPQKGSVGIMGRRFPAAADALLDWIGLDRSTCLGLTEVATCDRGDDPDRLCGNDSSGTACNRTTGRCIPEFSGTAGGQTVVGARGVCRTDGSRTCPRPLECASAGNLPPGLSTFDGVCVPSRSK
jgi:hypothetical protein